MDEKKCTKALKLVGPGPELDKDNSHHYITKMVKACIYTTLEYLWGRAGTACKNTCTLVEDIRGLFPRGLIKPVAEKNYAEIATMIAEYIDGHDIIAFDLLLRLYAMVTSTPIVTLSVIPAYGSATKYTPSILLYPPTTHFKLTVGSNTSMSVLDRFPFHELPAFPVFVANPKIKAPIYLCRSEGHWWPAFKIKGSEVSKSAVLPEIQVTFIVPA